MSKLVEPHGGRGLKALLAPQTERAEELERARRLIQVPMTSREVSDVLMLAMGAYTPLDGFMTEADWRGIARSLQEDIDRRVSTLQRLRNDLDGCIGCGCLSLKRCALYNPEDAAARRVSQASV